MFIFSNLATSIDGKIATTDRSLFHLGTAEDRREMQRLRRRADAVLMGASTLRAFRGPLAVRGARRQPINVIISRALEGVSPSWDFFLRPEIKRILFVTEKLPLARVRRFETTSTIIILDESKDIAPQIVSKLARLGVKRLLVEGGGGVMWDFAKHDLLDELHVTLTPWILGGSNAPTLVDGAGFSPKSAPKLKLARVRRIKNELFLTYQRTK